MTTKTVLITGSTRGIGLAMAKKFAQEGANVVLNGSRQVSEELIEEFKAYPGQVFAVSGDVSDPEVAKDMVEQALAEFGTIDILINNAGITKDKLMLKMKIEDFDDVLAVNLRGAFNMSQAVLKSMIKNRSGQIINMTSVVGLVGNAGQANYAASKAGLIGLTKSLAREVASRHILVNAIAPGFVTSDMTDKLSDKIKETMQAQVPLKRFGQAEEVADLAYFLANQSYMTGQVVTIDGGLTI